MAAKQQWVVSKYWALAPERWLPAFLASMGPMEDNGLELVQAKLRMSRKDPDRGDFPCYVKVKARIVDAAKARQYIQRASQWVVDNGYVDRRNIVERRFSGL